MRATLVVLRNVHGEEIQTIHHFHEEPNLFLQEILVLQPPVEGEIASSSSELQAAFLSDILRYHLMKLSWHNQGQLIVCVLHYVHVGKVAFYFASH